MVSAKRTVVYSEEIVNKESRDLRKEKRQLSLLGIFTMEDEKSVF